MQTFNANRITTQLPTTSDATEHNMKGYVQLQIAANIAIDMGNLFV